MPLHTTIFASTLFLLALFFALKEREVYSGSTTFMTRFLVRHSPAAEDRWNRCVAWLAETFESFFDRIGGSLKRVGARIGITIRYLIAVVADRMIKAVRGEKLLERNGASSIYLKQLKEHKDENGKAPEGPTS